MSDIRHEHTFGVKLGIIAPSDEHDRLVDVPVMMQGHDRKSERDWRI